MQETLSTTWHNMLAQYGLATPCLPEGPVSVQHASPINDKTPSLDDRFIAVFETEEA